MEKDKAQVYYAVIFTSVISDDTEGYEEMAIQMIEAARNQEGFMGIDSARENVGITISYWESLEAIKNWKNNSLHMIAQKMGKEKWYNYYKVRISTILCDYEFNKL